MLTYAFDIEIFKNFFSATFVNVEDPADEHVFVINLDRDDKDKLVEFLCREMILVGYNSDSFDCPMLRFIMDYHGKKLLSDLHSLSSNLMDDNYRNDKTIMALRYPKDVIYTWKSVDLMRILAFDKLGISLKQTGINLKWHKIQDIPISPYAEVKPEQLDLILAYNRNDVLITKRLYEEITPLRKLRADLSALYNVDLSSASDSRMANLILEHIYANELKMDIRSVRQMRTPRDKVLLGSCVAKFVSFQSPVLKELLQRISSTYVYAYNHYKYSDGVPFANCNFVLGVGGLHSEDCAGVFESDSEYLIQDMDVASYYPNLIINNNFFPQHLGPKFIQVLKKITAERLQAKKSGDKVKADGLKITINSIFGKTGSEHFWLYDPKQFLSTTISGQMGLLMLVEGMYLNGIEVLSCNTDGVVCKIRRNMLDKYYEVAHAWERTTGLELEFTPYKKYVRRDVNSYITVKEDGSTKEKGVFVKEVDLKKSYHMPIVAKALYAYYVDGVPVRTTLEQCKDIMEFCISQKSGGNFAIELHTGSKIEPQQKTNRFYITTRGGALIKRSLTSKKTTGMYVGRLVRILNDYDNTVPFEDYRVDLSFYEKEVMKVISEINPPQLTLFDLSFQDAGKKTKMALAPKEKAEATTEKDITVHDLKKLGKNQLINYVKTIATNKQKVAYLHPRYVYILSFDARSMQAEMYCLAKAVTQSIPVNKAAYKKFKLEEGQLVYCDKFDKTDTGHILSEYRVVDKIEILSESFV